MARYIVFDNYSGYIWGDSASLFEDFIGTPTDYAAAIDAALDAPASSYTEVGRHVLASNEDGYHIYRADLTVVPLVEDGQDQAIISAVLRDAEYVTTLRCDRQDG